MTKKHRKKPPIYIDVSNDSSKGISHSSMRGRIILSCEKAIDELKFCENLGIPDVDKDDIMIAMSALTRIRNQVKEYEERVIRIDNREEYLRLTGLGG